MKQSIEGYVEDALSEGILFTAQELESGGVGVDGKPTSPGRGSAVGKLTLDEALAVKMMFAMYEYMHSMKTDLTPKNIGQMYGVGPDNVRKIGRGDLWSHLPDVEYIGPSLRTMAKEGTFVYELVKPPEEVEEEHEEECEACRRFGEVNCRVHGDGGW